MAPNSDAGCGPEAFGAVFVLSENGPHAGAEPSRPFRRALKNRRPRARLHVSSPQAGIT